MNAKTVEHQQYSVTVQEASGLMGMRRSILREHAFVADEVDPKKLKPVDDDEATHILRLISYPDYVACLTASQGLPDPLTFEAFIQLPDQFLDLWGRAVYELNPHWLGIQVDQKKASKPGASSTSSRRKNAPGTRRST